MFFQQLYHHLNKFELHVFIITIIRVIIFQLNTVFNFFQIFHHSILTFLYIFHQEELILDVYVNHNLQEIYLYQEKLYVNKMAIWT